MIFSNFHQSICLNVTARRPSSDGDTHFIIKFAMESISPHSMWTKKPALPSRIIKHRISILSWKVCTSVCWRLSIRVGRVAQMIDKFSSSLQRKNVRYLWTWGRLRGQAQYDRHRTPKVLLSLIHYFDPRLCALFTHMIKFNPRILNTDCLFVDTVLLWVTYHLVDSQFFSWARFLL